MSIFSKIIKAKRESRLALALKSRVLPLFLGLKYTFHDPAANNVILISPDYVEPSKEKLELEIVNRIFKSFKKMKEDQKKVSKIYLPSSLWEQQINNGYSYFTEAIKSNDLDKFHFFLSNFGSWKQYQGVESTTMIKDKMKTIVGRRYLKNVVFFNAVKNWKWFYNNRKNVSSLTYPRHGNQVGALIDNTFVGAGSFFNEIYGSLLCELVDDISRPVVAELGAGYGKLAYFALRNIKSSCFLDFDIPETLCLAAYYLMKTWPEKKVLLYGEEEYSKRSHDKYELIFMPSYEIEKISKNSIDLFINKNSLGEMTREATANYVRHIASSTRYFFHMNHDVFPNVYTDDSAGLLGHEYPIPKDMFKLIFRYPDMGHIMHHGKVDYYMDIFIYLYERRVQHLGKRI